MDLTIDPYGYRWYSGIFAVYIVWNNNTNLSIRYNIVTCY